MIYYNEFYPPAADRLRYLISVGALPKGDVDDRSITEVSAEDLKGYKQCHFFAGIGGWPLALQTAGWPEDLEIWTGSCPCQPFSTIGQQKGEQDERHLWPYFRGLLKKRKPPAAIGEQVASPLGREWLSGVRSDLETLGYEVGAADLCAASVGAPHIRQRLWWVGDSIGQGLEGHSRNVDYRNESGRQYESSSRPASETGGDSRVPNSDSERFHGINSLQWSERKEVSEATGSSQNYWSDAIWIPCADGKQRRIEPRISPLAHGVPGRVELLKGYGNAIVHQLAAQFILSYMEASSL